MKIKMNKTRQYHRCTSTTWKHKPPVALAFTSQIRKLKKKNNNNKKKKQQDYSKAFFIKQ